MFRLHLAELLLKADRPEEARIHFERFAADAQDTTGPARRSSFTVTRGW